MSGFRSNGTSRNGSAVTRSCSSRTWPRTPRLNRSNSSSPSIPGSNAQSDSTAVIALPRHGRTSGSSSAKTLSRRSSLLRMWRPTRTEEHPDVYGITSRRISKRQVFESIARRGDSVSLGERRRIRFPSVRLQPPRCAARWRRTGCPSLLAPAVTMSHSNSTTRTASWCRSMGLNHRALSIAWIVIERTRAVV